MNPTPLQKIKSRLTLLNVKSNHTVNDGNYAVYKIQGEEELGKPFVYMVSFEDLTERLTR